MFDTDKDEFKIELNGLLELFSKDSASIPVLRHWWSALNVFSLDEVIGAFDEYVKNGKNAPRPADIVEILVSKDGRPTSDEAWATALQASDEGATVIWTDEISGALSMGAGDLLAEGDNTAARMAFRDSYNRLVDQARDNGIPINITVSLGHNVEGRNPAIEQAVQKGLLSEQRGNALMLDKPTKKGNEFKRLAGQAIASKDKSEVLANLKKMREVLA